MPATSSSARPRRPWRTSSVRALRARCGSRGPRWGEGRLVGDAMADVTLAFAPVAERRSRALEEHDLAPDDYVLVTAHRAGNVDDPARLLKLLELIEAPPPPAVFPP